MPPAKITLAETLATIRREAPGLREAGVLKFEVGEVRVHLAPPALRETSVDPSKPTINPDPLDDPETWGMPPGATPPGFKHRIQKDEDI